MLSKTEHTTTAGTVVDRSPRDGDIRADGVVWQYEEPASGGSAAWGWSHLDLVNARARVVAEADAAWSHVTRQVLTGQDETPRILVYDDIVAGVLPSYARASATDEYEVTHWHFVASTTRLVTGRRHAARSLAAAYHALRDKGVVHGPAGVVGAALTDFARSARTHLATLDDDLDRAEDAMLDREESGARLDLAGRLGQVRREAVVLRRELAPVLRGLEDHEDGLPIWFDAPELDAARSAVHGVLDDITALTERARSLQDELTSRLADQTNRRLYLVSIVTTLVMPATFVTGFFGMNTGGLIWSGDDAHFGTAYATVACVGAVGAMLMLLKWRRLL